MKALLFFLLSFTSSYAQSVLRDIGPGSESCDPRYLTALGTTLYFVASDINGDGLWKSDGTGIGTVLVKGGLSISSPLVVLNGKLFFMAREVGASVYNPWVSDGTNAGTILIKNLFLGNLYRNIDVDPEMTIFKGEIYFKICNEIDIYGSRAAEIWKTDGTFNGTVIVTSGSGLDPLSLSYFTVFNNELYYAANDGEHGMELWKTDGTTSGTSMVKDIYVSPYYGRGADPRQLKVFNNALYFSAKIDLDREMYKTDGTAAGTILLKDINPNGSSQNIFTSYCEFNNELYFQADDGINGFEFWKTNGTEVGTVMVKDIFPGTTSSSPTMSSSNGISNDKLYFQASDQNGTEIWITDGTSTGTVIVKDILPGPMSSQPMNLFVYNGLVYFASDAGTGMQLWRTDGTNIGTVMITNYASQNFSPDKFCVANNVLYFKASTLYNGSEVWKYYRAAPVTTGVLDQTSETNTFSVYPNPASEVVKVDFADVNDVVSLSVYSPSGVLVNEFEIQKEAASFNLDVQNLISGMYYIVLADAAGQKITQKMIKK